MRVVITGVPGVGKTSICKGLGLKVVNFGDFMMEIAKKYGIKHRDELRKKLSIKDYIKIQKEAAKKIGKMEEVVVDTHCSIRMHGGYYPGLPFHVLEELKPRAIIVVEADPGDIVKRRAKDKGIREREMDMEEIREHQEVNRYFAAAYSALSNAPIFFVRNEEGKLEEAIEEVKKILEGL